MIASQPTTTSTVQPPRVAWTYHVLIWTFYTLFWHIVQSATVWDARSLSISVSYTLANIAISYFNVFYLMPRLLYRKQIFLYVIALTGAFVFFSFALLLIIYGWLHLFGYQITFVEMQQSGFIGSTFGSNLSAALVTMMIHLWRQRVAMQRRQRQLEKLQLTTELNYLKSQLNPHFLFNALNSIYFLIKKDADAAADALAGFADLLRYQLYQTDGETIALSSELENIKKYIQLAALRKSDRLTVTTNFAESISDQQITPLLLLPLVENAFKHVAKGASEIRIVAYLVAENKLRFVVSNPYEELTTVAPVREAGGIGLKNIQRRLELIYPQRHTLQIEKTEGLFTVILEIKL